MIARPKSCRRSPGFDSSPTTTFPFATRAGFLNAPLCQKV
jgi:hypothetical protein